MYMTPYVNRGYDDMTESYGVRHGVYLCIDTPVILCNVLIYYSTVCTEYGYFIYFNEAVQLHLSLSSDPRDPKGP
jgi:hypothetical protein